ncbi:MAG TPA: tetratricopeptide repeat protein [Kiritimatiellia bacterium]|nr:tetratricopeptide repeat protein [Kiritimatiellia bacterium]
MAPMPRDTPNRRRLRWVLLFLALAAVPLAELALRALSLGQSRAPVVAEGVHLRDNPYFGLLVFPRQLARHGQHFRVERETGAYRVVVLGESAAMGDPAPAFGLARQLEVLLGDRIAHRPVEVINLGITAINAHVVRRIAADLPRLKPDAVVVYMGNNEVIGPFAPGGVFGRAAPAGWVRIQLAARGTRLGQLLARGLDRAARRESSAHRWHGLAFFEQRPFTADDPALPGVYRNFAVNLEAILQHARRANARVVLCTVAVNEQMAPFGSATNAAPDLHAESRWRAARAALAAEGPAAARPLFQRARDLDTLRFRADSRINDLIRTRGGRDGVLLVDAEAALGADPDHFLDHVHFSFRGNARLAALIANALAPGADESGLEEQLALRLAHTPREELRVLEKMAARLSGRPYIGRADQAERFQRIAARQRELRPRAGDIHAEGAALQAALAARPRDAELMLAWGQVLEETRRLDATAEVYRAALREVPHHTRAHLLLGRVLAAQGRVDDALRHFELGAPLAAHPRAEALATLGSALVDAGRRDVAERYFREAVKVDPRHVIARYNLGLLLAWSGRTDEALREYFAVLDTDPGFAQARNNAAALLHRMGRSREALEHLRRITAEEPGYRAAWQNLAGVAARLGLTNESADALAQATALALDDWSRPTR